MKIAGKTRIGAAVAVAAAASLVLAGCSVAGDSGGSSSASSSAPDGADCATPAGVDWDSVQSILKPYFSSTSEASLPVSGQLPQPPAENLVIDYLDNGTPVSTLMWQNLATVKDVLPNATINDVQVGSDAQSINTGLNTVIESKPDIVISVALDPTFYVNQLQQMKSAGIQFIGASITNAADFGLEDVYSGLGAQTEWGKVLAAAGLALTCGTSKEYVFYNVPELAFSNVQMQATSEELKKLCADCTLREVNIPVAQMDSSGADMIVSDLQAHPNTGAFMTSVDEMQIGLQQKMQIAGLPNIPGIGQSSTPTNIQQIADGTQVEGMAVDLKMLMWLLVDQALRERAGMPNPAATMDWSTYDQSISRILTKDTAGQYNNETGFVAIPDMEQQFAAMWGVAK